MNFLETEQLILRKWTVDDADDFYEIDSNPKVTTPIGWGTHKDKNKSFNFLNSLTKRDNALAIISKENNKAIGYIGFGEDSGRRGVISSKNIMYALNEDYWGKGFCTEAVMRLIKYLFEDLKLEIISAQHFSYNLRSKKVIERCGLKYEGTIRGYTKKKNVFIDNVIYSMTKDEYNEFYSSRTI